MTWLALEAVHRVLEVRRELTHALDDALGDEHIERGDAGGARDRVGRVRVAVRELDHVLGAAGVINVS